METFNIASLDDAVINIITRYTRMLSFLVILCSGCKAMIFDHVLFSGSHILIAKDSDVLRDLCLVSMTDFRRTSYI